MHTVENDPAAPKRRGFTRRTLLGASIGAVAVGSALGAAGATLSPRPQLSARSYSGTDLLGTDPVQHLVRRVSFGPTPDLLADVRATGMSAWLAREAATPANQIDPLGPGLTAALPRLGASAADLAADATNGRKVLDDLVLATAVRAAWSPRQLHEVMTMFWQNHFNVYLRDNKAYPYRANYDAAIRAASLTSFANLLSIVETHPAMLVYLNANQSTKTNPNENLGRELLELHTLGVGSYGEDDVKASALMLTGLTVKNNAFFFNPKTHYTGALTITSFSHANTDASSGKDAILAYLDFLAHHPATAQHIASQLATRFVSDQPSDQLVQSLAQTYLDHDTQVMPVLNALFGSDEFAASIGQKYRDPFGDAIASIRTLGHSQPSDAATMKDLGKVITTVQQTPYAHAMPDGYPLTIDAWLNPSSALARMNVHYDLASSGVLASNFAGVSSLLASTPGTWGELVDALANRVLFTQLLPEHRAAILTLAGKSAGDAVAASDLNSIVGRVVLPAVLSSPYHWSC